MKSSRIAVLVAVAALLAVPSSGSASTKKSYINAYVLIMDCTERAMSWVEKNKDDPAVGKLALELAEANMAFLQEFSPPKEFIEIHPHLVSIVENSANAFESISSGSPASFSKYKKNVQKERKALYDVMRELNFVFPSIINT